MKHPAIDPILILQEHDRHRLAIEAQLLAGPQEALIIEQKIAAEKAALEASRDEVRHLESKKKLLETEIGSAEDKLAKYRTQQVAVRKNDAYQALGHEIEATQAAIGELEGQELEVMYAIDSAKQRFAEREKQVKENIAGHQQRLKQLAEREVSLQAELTETQAAVAAARTPVGDRVLRVYDRIASRQMPVCVGLRSGTCNGCHLKVSSEIDALARKGEELVTCDQCGRIVWFES